MRNYSINSISKKTALITTLTVGVAISLWIFFDSKKKSEVVRQSVLFNKVIVTTLGELKSRWELGDIENHFTQGKLNCPSLIVPSKLVGQEYLQCNRLYLECFFAGKAGLDYPGFEININNDKFHVKAKQNNAGMYTSLSSKGEVIIDLEIEELQEFKTKVKLENTCNSVLLPERIYAAGTYEDTSKIWDSFGQKIFVDRYYVSNKDVNEWIEASGVKLSPQKEPLWYPFPSTNLTLEQRRQYCAFRGKQLLASRVLDAASYIPDDSKVNAADPIYKYPYYWTKNKRESFLMKAREGRLAGLTPQDCARAYVLGCQNQDLIVHFPSDPVSWMGMKMPLGYYPESVVNHFDPTKNLMPSSLNLPAESINHEIGRRGSWDGQGNSVSDIEVPGEDFVRRGITTFDIAFRCMKVVGG